MSRSTTNYGTKPTTTTTFTPTEASVFISRENEANAQVMGSTPQRFKYLRAFLCRQHPDKDFSVILKKFEEEFPLPDVPLKRNRKRGRKVTQHKAAAKTENGEEEKENMFLSGASSSKVALSQSNSVTSIGASLSNNAGLGIDKDADGYRYTEADPGNPLHENRDTALTPMDQHYSEIGNRKKDSYDVSDEEAGSLKQLSMPEKIPTAARRRSRQPRLMKTSEELKRESALKGLIEGVLSKNFTLPCMWVDCETEFTGNAQEFEAHIRRHTTTSSLECRWDGCQGARKFQTADTLTRHCRDSHTDKVWFYKCQDCTANPMRPVLETLTRHKCTERTCTLCKKVLSSIASYRKHVECCTRDESFTFGESSGSSRTNNKRRRIGS